MIKSSQKGTTRQLLISGEIEWDTLGEVYEHLVGGEPYAQILLLIASQGGDRDAGISLLSFLRGLSSTITTVAVGKVYSAAIYPFLASKDRRYALPDAMFLFHPTTIDMEGENYVNTLRENVEADSLDSDHLRILLNSMSIPIPVLSHMTSPQTSIFISAKSAEQYGLVTKVIEKFSEILA